MRLLALDLSSHCGWALLDGDPGPDALPELVDGGCLHLQRVEAPYPRNYVEDVVRQGESIALLVRAIEPEEVVIEETNGGGRAGRYTQKFLEMLHLAVLERLMTEFPTLPISYISSSTWRRVIGIALSADEKKRNRALQEAKRRGKDALKDLKKKLGVRGKINKKHIAVRWASSAYNLTLTQGDNDFAEALALGVARLRGATLATPKETTATCLSPTATSPASSSSVPTPAAMTGIPSPSPSPSSE